MNDLSADDVYLHAKQSLQFEPYSNVLKKEIDEQFIQLQEETHQDINGAILDPPDDVLVTDENKQLSLMPEMDWKLETMLGGHNGWVRCIEIDPVSNEWFVSGGSDSNIKVWNLTPDDEGHYLQNTLQGHVMGVRDIEISTRNPYLFSCSEDKLIKCWDLESNQVIRDYYGHLSGVYSVVQHPTIDQIIVSGGRDSTAKVWDIRSRTDVMTLVGHKQAINKVICFPVEPQVVTCSNDNTIRLWDLRNSGKPLKIITNHDKHVRDIVKSDTEFSFASCSTNTVLSWALPEGRLLSTFQSQGVTSNATIKPTNLGIVNTLSISSSNILFAGTDSGDMVFYDYVTGQVLCQKASVYYNDTSDDSDNQTTAYGDHESSEGFKGILTSAFDKTGNTLLTGEVDKFVKIWRRQD